MVIGKVANTGMRHSGRVIWTGNLNMEKPKGHTKVCELTMLLRTACSLNV